MKSNLPSLTLSKITTTDISHQQPYPSGLGAAFRPDYIASGTSRRTITPMSLRHWYIVEGVAMRCPEQAGGQCEAGMKCPKCGAFIRTSIFQLLTTNALVCPSCHQAGMKCPKCGAFIRTSIFQLLTTNALVCPSCHLRLNIDRMKSKPAFDALRKVQAAKDNLEKN